MQDLSKVTSSEAIRIMNLENEESRRLEKTDQRIIFPERHPEIPLVKSFGTCPGYGSRCGKDKDYDKDFCDDCQDSADLDAREEVNAAYWRKQNLV